MKTNKPKMTKQQAIDELRNDAKALENKPCSITEFARNAYKAKIRNRVADKLEQELKDELEEEEKNKK